MTQFFPHAQLVSSLKSKKEYVKFPIMHVYIVQPDTFKDDCPLESKIEQESAASEPSSN